MTFKQKENDKLQIISEREFLSNLKKSKKREKASQETLTIETSPDNLIRVPCSKKSLTELLIKQNGEQWQFHKNDADPWPSELHGHYNNLVLDAKTGKVYDSVTRKYSYTLKPKELDKVQARLLSSKDFAEKAKKLFSENLC